MSGQEPDGREEGERPEAFGDDDAAEIRTVAAVTASMVYVFTIR